MKRIANGHSSDHLKDKARKLKKALGISQYEALNRVAQEVGFDNWKNFINESTPGISAPKSVANRKVSPGKATASVSATLPTPMVLTYRRAMVKNSYQRPNAIMAIESHQSVAKMLKVLKRATQLNKRAHNALSDVADQLDEWVQREHATNKKLNDIFYDLYYGEVDVSVENRPTKQRAKELLQLCKQVKAVISREYHDCKPLQTLMRQMDIGIKWIGAWPAAKRERSMRKDVAVAAGTMIYLGTKNKPAILISHDVYSGRVEYYSDKGLGSTNRVNITVPKDQSGADTFRPMRLWLPYGKWFCPDGTQVLFNRDYYPLWSKLTDGRIVTVSPQTWIDKNQEEYFFKDGSAPWLPNKKTQLRCREELKAWGVEDGTPELLLLLSQAITTNDVSLLNLDRGTLK